MSDLLDGYMAYQRAAGYSEATLSRRGYVLRRAARELPLGLDQASTRELERWLGRADWSAWTRYAYFEHLYGFFSWAVRRGYLDWSPMDDLTRPRSPRCEPRPASEEQLVLALSGLLDPWRRAVLLAGFQGLRAGEIARLARVDVTRTWVRVLRKGGREQLLPTHDAVWAAVQGLPAGPVVPTGTGRFYRPQQLSQLLSQQLTRLGLPELTLHSFRHRFATVALLPRELGGAGADIRTVQELMGHASLSSTQIYTLVTSRQLRAAVAALPDPR